MHDSANACNTRTNFQQNRMTSREGNAKKQCDTHTHRIDYNNPVGLKRGYIQNFFLVYGLNWQIFPDRGKGVSYGSAG